MHSDTIIHSCPNANCHHPIYTGKCLDECWRRYRGETKKMEPDIAYWKHRGEHNDYIWAECSNCGFREENWKVVRLGKSDTDYVDVRYKYCPMCGKEMRVK